MAAVDASVFANFVRDQSHALFGTAYLLTNDAAAAEELLQDTLTALYGKWDRVAVADKPLAYVRRALVNRFVSQRRRPRPPLVTLSSLTAAPAPDIAERVTDTAFLMELIRQLPDRQRAAVVLRYFHDLPDEAIAAAIGCRRATVRSLISRALASMRTRVSSEDPERSGGIPA